MKRLAIHFFFLCAAGQASTSIESIVATPTQAVVKVRTDQPGPCIYRASESQSFNAVVHDVNTNLFQGANSDSRSGSLIRGELHTFVLGQRIAQAAADGKRYSRALQANTKHWIGVTCGKDSEVVQSFDTENPPLGRTAPEAPPFDSTAFGNYGWPSIDWTDPSRTYVDPMTGILLKRITASNWKGKVQQNVAFSKAFDLNSAWTSADNIVTWPGKSGTVASYSGTASDPIFVAADLSTIPDYGYGAMAVSGWTPLTTIDDVMLRTFGFGSDGSAENRKILVCLSIDSGNTCDTPETEVALPAGSSSIGPTAPAGFPSPSWTSWSATVPYHGRDWGTVITTVTTSGHTITNTGSQSAQFFSRGWKPGAKVVVNGTELYTIAKVNNGGKITTVESLTAHDTAVPFKSLAAGVRIRKKTASGTVNLSLGYDVAMGEEYGMPFVGARNLCSPVTVTVKVDAAGRSAPDRDARLCVAHAVSNSHVLFAFFPDNGEARLLSNFTSQAGFQYHAPDWVQYDGSGPSYTVYSSGNVWHPTVGTRLYSIIKFSNGHSSLVKVDYTGDFREYSPGYSTGAIPADGLTYNVLGFPSQNLAVDQQAASFGNPLFDPTLWSTWSFIGILDGGKAAWQASTACCGESPTFFALQDVNTGQLTSLIDTISTYPLRFWGNHGTQALAGKFFAVANILGNKGVSSSNFLGGPFVMYPTEIKKNGVWTADTSLSSTYADTCPAATALQWQALGATGQNCVLMRAKQPCSDFAGPPELSKFPCPWDRGKSMVSTLAVGDRFWLDYNYNSGTPTAGAETMRIITDPAATDTEGVVEFWALRRSENYGNLNGPYNGNNYAHLNGWTGWMIPPEARTAAFTWIDDGGNILQDNYALAATHSDVGAGSGTDSLTAIMAGRTPFNWGIRWDRPLAAQIGQLGDYDINANGRFAGKDNGGGSMESYASMRQIAASDNEKRWFLDLRHMSPFFGSGQEVYSNVGPITAAPVAGTWNVYRFTRYPGNNSDIKVFPPLAYAGPYLLWDMSSANTGDQITDAIPWSYCYAYKSGECRADSAPGQIFVSVPKADTRGLADGTCIGGWYAEVNPCAWIPFAMQSWGIQVDASRKPADDNYWRKLTLGFSGPGRQYEFGNITPIPDGTWAFMQGYWLEGVRNELLAMKLPNFPVKDDSTNRADYITMPVSVARGPGIAARARFGYAEHGYPTSFFCTSRKESCLTDGAAKPFAYAQSDTLTAVPCAGRCQINIPAISGRVLYYAVERLDPHGNVVYQGDLQAIAVP